jgi:hypothetical protein
VKYAVYIVIVEDTEEADQHLAEQVVSLERLDGGLSEPEAEQILREKS